MLVLVSSFFCLSIKLQALISTIALTPIAKGDAKPIHVKKVVCLNPHLTGLATVVTIVGLVMWLYAHCRHLTWFNEYKYNRTCALYIFLFNTYFYVPVKLKHLSGNMHMYKLKNAITPEQMSYHKSCLWDIIHFEWHSMHLCINGQPVNLPSSVNVPLKNKHLARWMFVKEDLDLQFMIKQGSN